MRLKPATEEQYGIRGEGLGSHGDEGHHDCGLGGRVVWENVVFHIRAKGEVATGASHCVHSSANGDGTWRCQGEMLGRSLPHAGVDWDRRNMTLKVGHSTYLKTMWYYLIAKAEGRNDSKDIGPGFRLVFDRSWCVPSNEKFNHNQDDNVNYGQSACKEKELWKYSAFISSHTCHWCVLQKINCFGVAERQDQNDTERYNIRAQIPFKSPVP